MLLKLHPRCVAYLSGRWRPVPRHPLPTRRLDLAGNWASSMFADRAYMILSRNGFHATALCNFPVRRRRRRENTGVEDQAGERDDEELQAARARHVPVTDPTEFATAADALLNEVYEALVPLRDCNDFFFLTRDTDDIGPFILLDLGPSHGQYNIQVDRENCTLLFQSPITGRVIYHLSTNDHEWVGIEDGHAFKGLLVRDLIRQVQGVPNL